MFGQLVDEGAGPPVRKRRRPALSCIECRRRKIKCDRTLPCNHCKQTKNSSCTYKDHHPSSSNRRTSPRSQTTQRTDSVPEYLIQAPPPSNGDCPDGSSFQLLSHTSSPRTAATFQEWGGSEKASNASTRATTIEDNQSQNNEQGLVNRVRVHKQTLPDAMKATDDEITGERWQKALGISFSTFNDVVVQDGDLGARLRTKFFNESLSTPIKELRGSMSKTRFFGQTHWLNSFDQFFKICAVRDKVSIISTDSEETNAINAEVRRTLEQCKNIARKIKAQRSVKYHLNLDLKEYMPSRDRADTLVRLYIRTMESTHRVLHIPQFLREYEGYWQNPERTSGTSIIKILLVMAIGACFYQEEDNEAVRESARQWVYSAQAWVAAPFEKGRLNLSGLQVHCLLLIARQTNALGGDLIWIAAGSLLRSAIQMGFHRDPKYFPKLSVMHGELRRRLWATVVELSIQTSLDTGMPPLITANDFDTEPPLNIDDTDISETTEVPPTPKPPNAFTQSSLQIQFLKSLPTRLQISAILNSLQPEPSYDLILRLGSEIAQACKESALLMQSYPQSLPRPTVLQRNLLDLFLRRFTLAVHRPFAIKSTAEPRYYFSRKVCIDTGLIILSHTGRETTPLSPSPPSPVNNAAGKPILDDYAQLCSVGGGFYKEIILYGGVTIVLELIQQLEDDAASGLPPSPSSTAARQPLKDSVETLNELLSRRIRLGENNVKGFLFLNAARGQIKALEEGGDLEGGIVEGARVGAQTCLQMLRERARVTAPLVHEIGDQISAGGGSWQGVGGDGGDNNMMIGGGGGGGGEQSPEGEGEGGYGYDFMMQDDSPGSMANFNFDIPDSWLFSGWGDIGQL